MLFTVPKLWVQKPNESLPRIKEDAKPPLALSILAGLFHTDTPQFDEPGDGINSVHSDIVVLGDTGVMEVLREVINEADLVTLVNAEPPAWDTGGSMTDNNFLLCERASGPSL